MFFFQDFCLNIVLPLKHININNNQKNYATEVRLKFKKYIHIYQGSAINR